MTGGMGAGQALGAGRWARAGNGRASAGRWRATQVGELQADGRKGARSARQAAHRRLRQALRDGHSGLPHYHGCCDTTPVCAVRKAMHGLGAACA